MSKVLALRVTGEEQSLLGGEETAGLSQIGAGANSGPPPMLGVPSMTGDPTTLNLGQVDGRGGEELRAAMDAAIEERIMELYFDGMGGEEEEEEGPSMRIPQGDGKAGEAGSSSGGKVELTAEEMADLEELGDLDNLESDEEEGDEEEEGGEESMDLLGSDLDSDSDDPHGEDTNQLILCKYDRVSRNKNRWKIVLIDGMGHLNGRDIVFSKASGGFAW